MSNAKSNGSPRSGHTAVALATSKPDGVPMAVPRSAKTSAVSIVFS